MEKDLIHDRLEFSITKYLNKFIKKNIDQINLSMKGKSWIGYFILASFTNLKIYFESQNYTWINYKLEVKSSFFRNINWM